METKTKQKMYEKGKLNTRRRISMRDYKVQRHKSRGRKYDVKRKVFFVAARN